MSTLAAAMPQAAGVAADPAEANRAAIILLARFARGDRSAFDELVAEHQQAAYTAAWRILGDGEAAHDVVQEAFVRVLQAIHERYEADKSFRAAGYAV